MANPSNDSNDETLMNLLVENKTLVNFLFTIFGFLGRKTDFYMIRDEENSESMGFPPGVAEELVIKILRKCDPFQNIEMDELDFKISPRSDFVPSTVAEEVEIETSDFETHSKFNQQMKPISCQGDDQKENIINTSWQPEDVSNVESMENLTLNCSQSSQLIKNDTMNICREKYEPEPMRSEEIDKFNTAESQKNSESYNGAKRDKYSWAQKIGELDVTVTLPPTITSAKCVRVNITSSEFSVDYCSEGRWESLIKDQLSHKIKSGETLWIMSEGKLLIHMEKQCERWWTSLLECEPKIDTSKIDCSRPLDELPEEHIAKVSQLQWNQMQKLAGKPTSEEIQKQQILKKAWNAEGSPFLNTPFDPNVLHYS